jgi:hypothetical protein
MFISRPSASYTTMVSSPSTSRSYPWRFYSSKMRRAASILFVCLTSGESHVAENYRGIVRIFSAQSAKLELARPPRSDAGWPIAG